LPHTQAWSSARVLAFCGFFFCLFFLRANCKLSLSRLPSSFITRPGRNRSTPEHKQRQKSPDKTRKEKSERKKEKKEKKKESGN
jgi:hypothetical protein